MNGAMVPKQASIKPTEPRPLTSPPPPVQREQSSPPSALHKHTRFSMAPPTSPPATFNMSPSEYVPRVRFTAPSGSGGESITSQSEASKIHMMAGSFASSSNMSSSNVMSEEDRRLAAMGMGCADPKSDTGRYKEEHVRL